MTQEERLAFFLLYNHLLCSLFVLQLSSLRPLLTRRADIPHQGRLSLNSSDLTESAAQLRKQVSRLP